jgi:hypothetical protein
VYPQPKFNRGNWAVLKTALDFMKDAHTFVDSVLRHPDSRSLNKKGKQWWKEFNDALSRLEKLASSR